MKERILHFLQTDRSYAGGVKIYNEIGPRVSFKRQLNFQPQSDYLMGCLLEELRQLSGMSHAEMSRALSRPVDAQKAQEKPQDPLITPELSDGNPENETQPTHQLQNPQPKPGARLKKTAEKKPVKAAAKKSKK